MTEKNKALFSTTHHPWTDNPNSIWLGSSVTLLRNLEKFKFPAKLTADKRKQILSLLGKDLLASPHLKNPKLIKAEDLLPIQKEYIMEHFLHPFGFQQAHSGEAFVLDDTGEFLGILNLKDHLTLQWLDYKDELEPTWDRLAKIEMDVNKNIKFAFNSKFGFLTSDPSQCGTALLAYVFLHLPALIYSERLEEVVKKYKDESVLQTGLQGDPAEIIGDIVVFHNAYTLGVTEENILSSLRTLTTKILVEEKSVRTHMKQESQSFMKDKVSRAYAILLHSYQIEAVEALSAISLVKLGLDLNWITGVGHESLNKLIVACRRAHLICHHNEKISQEEVPHKRAEFIHEALKGTSLHI